jgi:ankyrin repeat protein
VEALLDSGADVNASDRDSTPLMEAAESASPETVRLLLSRGAEVNLKRAQTGWTVLHSAARGDPSGKTVRLLLEKGAEVDARSRYIRMAAVTGHPCWSRSKEALEGRAVADRGGRRCECAMRILHVSERR